MTRPYVEEYKNRVGASEPKGDFESRVQLYAMSENPFFAGSTETQLTWW